MKNIILIGMPGSGKTTLGRAAADHLGRQFFDADECLEKWEKRSVADFFAESEAAFRAAETRTLKKLAEKEGSIIAAGGGAVIREENMAALRKTGIICFIDREYSFIGYDISLGLWLRIFLVMADTGGISRFFRLVFALNKGDVVIGLLFV